MADSVTQSTLQAKTRTDTFEFKIPTLHEEIGISSRMSKLRRVIDPTWDGFEQFSDGMALINLKACATFELLLEKSTAKWPFTTTPTGVVVDSSKFPADKVNDVLEAYQSFQQALATFRESGATNTAPAPAKTVEGEQNPG